VRAETLPMIVVDTVPVDGLGLKKMLFGTKYDHAILTTPPYKGMERQPHSHSRTSIRSSGDKKNPARGAGHPGDGRAMLDFRTGVK
jgi:hypothetical protein